MFEIEDELVAEVGWTVELEEFTIEFCVAVIVGFELLEFVEEFPVELTVDWVVVFLLIVVEGVEETFPAWSLIIEAPPICKTRLLATGRPPPVEVFKFNGAEMVANVGNIVVEFVIFEGELVFNREFGVVFIMFILVALVIDIAGVTVVLFNGPTVVEFIWSLTTKNKFLEDGVIWFDVVFVCVNRKEVSVAVKFPVRDDIVVDCVVADVTGASQK